MVSDEGSSSHVHLATKRSPLEGPFQIFRDIETAPSVTGQLCDRIQWCGCSWLSQRCFCPASLSNLRWNSSDWEVADFILGRARARTKVDFSSLPAWHDRQELFNLAGSVWPHLTSLRSTSTGLHPLSVPQRLWTHSCQMLEAGIGSRWDSSVMTLDFDRCT